MATVSSETPSGLDRVVGNYQDTTTEDTPNHIDFALESFDLPQTNQRFPGYPQKPGIQIPLALRPTVSKSDISLDSTIRHIRDLAMQGRLDDLLSMHGTILFRGLPILTALDFSKFSHAFGYSPHEIIGIVVDRPLLAPNVAPANEAPKTTNIGIHNESPQVPHGM